ncbi:hypothetical protein SAMN04488564_1316 [Lentzea waywayandensis]|uniref:Uncharacterized protein n=1 Tax=Lentzea waywayandensis TaxID=84724 RepID=A0A1I6FK46_9PSEU|nr:hypothetical protein [Lentzea waywayandensis]SFR30177.1 hypothetical protein SAMN04488564_1316 [Lentzea waywayandensis]
MTPWFADNDSGAAAEPIGDAVHPGQGEKIAAMFGGRVGETEIVE